MLNQIVFHPDAVAERLASYGKKTKTECLPLTPEQSRLVGDNHRLAFGFLNRKCRWVQPGEREELLGVLYEFLLRAAQTHDGSATFSTWADQWFRAAVSRWLYAKERRKTERVMSDMEKAEIDADYASFVPDDGVVRAEDEAERREMIGRLQKMLGERDFRVLEMQFAEGKSNAEIAVRLEVSKERVRQIGERARLRAKRAVRQRQKEQRVLEMEEVASEKVEYVGVCPSCQRAVFWCGPEPRRAEARGLVAVAAHADDTGMKWCHGAGCDRGRRRVRRKRMGEREREFEFEGVA